MNKFSNPDAFELAECRPSNARYDDAASRTMRSTIPDLVRVAKLQPAHRVLDVCCGTGDVVEHAIKFSRDVSALEASSRIVRQAGARFPGVNFVQGDPQDLPFADAEFDAVLTNFSHCRIPDPDRAIAEAARVLKPGGIYSFSTWCGPKTSIGFKIIFGTALANIDPDTDHFLAPDVFRLSDPLIAIGIMRRSGFRDVSISTFQTTITCKAEEFVDFLESKTARPTKLLRTLPYKKRMEIENLILAQVREYAADGTIVLPVPSRIISGVRTRAK